MSQDEAGREATRPETGPMAFGDDWPGVFIRGDNAAYYADILRRMLAADSIHGPVNDGIGRSVLEGLASRLEGSRVVDGATPAGTTLTLLRPFVECLPTYRVTPAAPTELASMEVVEERYVFTVLNACHGNKSKTARILGFDRRTLYRKLERYLKKHDAEQAALREKTTAWVSSKNEGGTVE